MKSNGRRLCRYVFPAVGGLCVTYLYNIIDGIFVGQGVGYMGLGAVNIGVPFITFVVAVAAMFPMGGATVVAIRMGRRNEKGANHAFMTALILTVLMSLILMAIGMLFPCQIARLSGASDTMLEMSSQYLFYYTAFSVPMLLSTCLSVFVRNDGSPGLAFWGMCAGAAANIFLDWLFIFPLQMGIIGAAIASGLGQVISLVVLLSHFVLKKGKLRITRISISAKLAGKICKRGIPEAISQLNTPVTALCYNLVLSQMIGDMGVSTFSVLSFIFSLANAILSGVVQGLQPLWGLSYGKKDAREMGYYFRAGIIMNGILSVLIYGVLFGFDRQIIAIFNRDPALIEMTSAALPVFALSFFPMGLNLVITGLLFSTKRTNQANVIAVSRGIVLKSLSIFCIPIIFGREAIWFAAIASESLTLTVAVILLRIKQIKWQ
ncbi:MAG: MATE family efflux transporter [Lachnospiraceae bacterium]|nr:MATE family efflux transporter [Lachnospiraceae bacterium]